MDYVTRIDLDYTRTPREIKNLDYQNASLGLVFLVFVRIEFKKSFYLRKRHPKQTKIPRSASLLLT